MTSNQQEKITEAQVDAFQKEVMGYLKVKIADNKRKIIDEEKKYYHQKVSRQKIQTKIDRDIFSRENDYSKMRAYLSSPRDQIEKAYNDAIKFSVANLEANFKTPDESEEVFDELKQTISMLESKFREEEIPSEETEFNRFFENLSSEEIFSISSPDYQEKSSIVFYLYLLDLLCGEPNGFYQVGEFRVQLKKNFQFNRKPGKSLRELFEHLRGKDLGMANFSMFVTILSRKLPDIRKQLFRLKEVNLEDSESFEKSVKTTICKEKCPCCFRICGEENIHEYHRCLYGHQIRALGKVKISNGDASVIRCEDLQPHSQIQFNGDTMSWTKFQDYWKKKVLDPWVFDDVKPSSERNQFFDRAWELVGPEFCRENDIIYVPSNLESVTAQKKGGKTSKKIHFIIVIDSSESMRSKWNETIQELTKMVRYMKTFGKAEELFKISLVPFSQYYQIQQQFIQLSSLNVHLQHCGGVAIIQRAFMGAIYLINKWTYSVDKSVFILISDGATSDPRRQVNELSQMMYYSNNSIEFVGISVGGSSRLMEKLTQEMHGKKGFSIDSSQLGSAFIEIIKREVE